MRPFAWLREATPEQRRSLLAAFLGYMLDAMDVMLYAFVLGDIQRELHLTSAQSGAMMSATLVAAAVGGIGFGWVADRFGRTKALLWSVLIYSVATAACGLSQTGLELVLCRMILGLGMGGEWAAGAALVAETWGAEHRGKALALVQSSWAVGYALGALLVAVILPRFGWRAVFFAGVIPALVTFWFRHGVKEPEAWSALNRSALNRSEQDRSAQDGTRGQRGPEVHQDSWRRLFRGEYGRGMLVCSSMNAFALFAYWGLFTWVPNFLSRSVAEGGRGLNTGRTSGWTIVMQTGTFLGYLMFSYFADRLGRKWTYIGYLLVAAMLVPLFAFVRNPGYLLMIGPLVGFFGTGYFSGFSAIASEMFPTSLRGMAMGFSYNIGRVLSAAAPYLIGAAAQQAGLSYALCITSVAFVIAAVIAMFLRPVEALPAVAEAVSN
jgi:MFS family permease